MPRKVESQDGISCLLADREPTDPKRRPSSPRSQGYNLTKPYDACLDNPLAPVLPGGYMRNTQISAISIVLLGLLIGLSLACSRHQSDDKIAKSREI
jgi:hypothetical protein